VKVTKRHRARLRVSEESNLIPRLRIESDVVIVTLDGMKTAASKNLERNLENRERITTDDV